MMTALEALLKDMLQSGWFTKSDGDTESPLGFFGYINVVEDALFLIRQAFADTIEVYGDPKMELCGYWFAMIPSSGIIHFWRKDSLEEAQKNFDHYVIEYGEWLGDDDA